MKKKIIVLVSLFLLIFQPVLVSAGNLPIPGKVCVETQMPDGTYLPSGQVREITYGGVRYRCVGCGTCTPISSGSSGGSSVPSTPYIPPASTSQQMAIGLMGAFLSSFFSTLLSGAFDNTPSHNDQKQRENEEQQRKLEEERKKQLLSQYNSLVAQAKNQTKPQTNQSNSPFTFQTLGGQISSFKWQSSTVVSSSNNSSLNSNEEKIRGASELTFSDLNKIFGNVLQDKAIEKIEEKIDNFGEKIVEKIDKKHGKDWGSKYYGKVLPIAKITVTAYTEGITQAGAETINYGISLIPMPTITSEVSDIGRKIYTKVAFTALDKFLSQTEKAADALGFNFNKDEFMQDFENDLSTGQKIIYKWLKGD